MSPAVVTMSAVHFAWSGRRRFTFAADQFSVSRGERLLIVGASGAGKSTLLSLICGVVTPRSGTIRVLDTDIGQLSGGARDRFRAEHFGIIFQMFNLLPYGTVLDNVLLPLAFAPNRRARATALHSAREEACRLLRSLGLDDDIHGAPAAALSVGQQQRVAAARALIGSPEIVVADEPTSALDQDRRRDFLDLLIDQVNRVAGTLVMVSHDVTLAPRFHRVVRLEDVAATGRDDGR